MAQFKFLLWLVEWYAQSDFFEFEWDIGNMFKILDKHDIDISEIESIFKNKNSFPLGIQVNPEIQTEDRFSIVGLSCKNRVLSVVFTFRGSKVRAISRRKASRKERKIYEGLCSQTIKNV
jgi:uncharacterized protein